MFFKCMQSCNRARKPFEASIAFTEQSIYILQRIVYHKFQQLYHINPRCVQPWGIRFICLSFNMPPMKNALMGGILDRRQNQSIHHSTPSCLLCPQGKKNVRGCHVFANNTLQIISVLLVINIINTQFVLSRTMHHFFLLAAATSISFATRNSYRPCFNISCGN